MSNCDIRGRRRRAIIGGLLAGLGLALGLAGGVSAIIEAFPVDTVFQPYPIGEDLIGAAVGFLALGLGVGLMVASTIAGRVQDA